MADFLNTFLDKAQSFRQVIQEKLGSSGNVITTSDLNRGLRAEGIDSDAEDELSKDMKKFIYFGGPVEFFKNQRKNIDEFVEKHISKPIKDLTGENQ